MKKTLRFTELLPRQLSGVCSRAPGSELARPPRPAVLVAGTAGPPWAQTSGKSWLSGHPSPSSPLSRRLLPTTTQAHRPLSSTS